jgi:hypothetical protein
LQTMLNGIRMSMQTIVFMGHSDLDKFTQNSGRSERANGAVITLKVYTPGYFF